MGKVGDILVNVPHLQADFFLRRYIKQPFLQDASNKSHSVGQPFATRQVAFASKIK